MHRLSPRLRGGCSNTRVNRVTEAVNDAHLETFRSLPFLDGGGVHKAIRVGPDFCKD